MSAMNMAYLQSAEFSTCSLTLAIFLTLISLDPCSPECFDVHMKPSACLPGPDNIVKRRSITVSPAGSTCGSPASSYCMRQPSTSCTVCNASNPNLSHGPQNMRDSDYSSDFWGPNYQPTWWQSITWWDARSRGLLVDDTIKVNLTVSLNKTYVITGSIKITFYSSKPNAFVFEKSTDHGVTWTPFKYYADNCNLRFGVQPTSSNRFQATCLQASNVAAIQGQQIVFRPLSAFPDVSIWEARIQEYLKATDIRIRLEYPWTDGNQGIQQERFLSQYYYDVTDLQVDGRCNCNGHAPYCEGPTQQQVCHCQHGTEGVDCERCMPLYNNKTWKAAEASDKPNPCEKCQCYDHAKSCVYNSTLGFGVCQDCAHNTTGYFCDKCKDQFYRNVSVALNHQKACLPCECFPSGITNNGTCNQVQSTNLSIGQCSCKENFHGRRCDLCKDGFYGVTVSPIGVCKACNCSAFGTFNRSITCDQISGQCTCKSSTDGKQCGSCKDGYHTFPNSSDGRCQSCVCDHGGAYSNVCSKTTGHCYCRRGIESTSCKTVMRGYFTPTFDYYRLEAESTDGNYETISSISGEGTEFTGRGYARLKNGNSLTFHFKPSFTARFYLVIRYKSNQQQLQLSVAQQDVGNSNTVHNSSFNLSLSGSQASTQAFYSHPDPMLYTSNTNYSIRLSIISDGNMTSLNQTLDVDSVVLMTDYNSTNFFQSSNQTTRNATRTCWQRKQGLPSISGGSSVCEQITFSVNSQIFNGSLACGCSVIGSVNGSTCEKHGGQCSCKPGVTGRTCNQCKPGFYNLTSNGCTPCNCTTLGSKSLVCDPFSGKCDCKPGVVNRTCSQCQDSFYGFQTGFGCRNCSCNWDGSAVKYCDENGVCTCKNTTTGSKCDMCKPLHFNFTSTGCTPCGCDSAGSTNLQCDLARGNCSCKKNVEGAKCDTCFSGTFNLQQSNPYGCQSCFCYDKTDTCSSSRGFYTSSIASRFVNGTDHWILTLENGLDANYTNTSLGISITPSDETPTRLSAPMKYLGNRLSSYAQFFIVNLILTNRPGVAKATIEVKLTISSAYNTVSFVRTLNTSSSRHAVRINIHEFYTANKASAWALQRTLSSVSLLSVHLNSTNISTVLITDLELSSASSSPVSASLSSFVENCSCPTNFSGLSCQNCASGYTRVNPGNDSYTGCQLCSCNSRSSSCDAQSGICSNCRIGTTGNYCQRCQPGVQEPECTKCIPGFYGLNDTSFEGCRPCQCMLLNTIGRNNSVCDEISGQCKCRPMIGGLTCNRCAENAANFTTGCQSCSLCYGLIQAEVHVLRRDIANITTSLTSVQDISELSASPTFGQRLDRLTQNITALAATANNSAGVESSLAAELAALNVSLDNMQSTLQVNVSRGINQTNHNLDAINGTMQQINALKDAVYGLLWGSSYVLQKDVVRQRDFGVNLTHDVNSTSVAVGKKLNEYRPVWIASNDSTMEVFTKSSYAVANTTAISSSMRRNEVGVNASSAKIQQLTTTTNKIEANSRFLQSNLSSIMNNITELSRRANLTLSDAEALDVSNNTTTAQLQTKYQFVQDNLTALNNTLVSLKKEFTAQERVVKDSRNHSQGVMTSLNAVENQTVMMSSQASNAQRVANSAVTSSSDLLKEAEDMQRIVQDFNKTSKDAENMASLSLKNTEEVNKTSREAIAYTNQIKTDLDTAVILARESLIIAQNASHVAGNVSSDLDDLSRNARVLKADSSTTVYEASYFEEVRLSLSQASTNTIQPSTSRCRNITLEAKKAVENATIAAEAAKNRSAEVAAKQAMVNKLNADFQRLVLLDASSLQRLQASLRQYRTSFDSSNTKTLVAQLRTSYLQQQSTVQQFRLRIAQLRTEIAELKSVIGSFSSLQGCR